jgi:hypothetical protein
MSTTPSQTITAKIERLQRARVALAEKAFTILFYAPDTLGVPSGAIIETYRLVATYRAQGYDAQILTELKDYQVPTYLDEDLQALPHQAIEGEGLLVGPEDMVVIPEYFTSIITKTAKLACVRVVLVQGYDNIFHNMIPGTSWAQLGIRHVWTMSAPLTAYVQEVMGNQYHVQTLRIGVPEYFKPYPIKDPVIAVQVRNGLDLQKISKEFYMRYPELRWVGFEPLAGPEPTGRSRRDYAALLARASVVLWVDRIAAFGQTAVEAMAAQTPLLALVPDRDPEYLADDNAVWVNRLSEIPEKLGLLFKLQIENSLPEWLLPAMAKTAATYSPAAAEQAAMQALTATLDLRDTELQDLILQFEAKNTAPSAA